MTINQSLFLKERELKKFAFNIGVTIGQQFFSLLIGVGTIIVIARILGPEGNGHFALALLLPMVFSQLFTLGIGAASVYYINQGEVSTLQAFKSNVISWFFLVLLGCSAGSLIIYHYNEYFFPGVPENLLWISLLCFPVLLLYDFIISLLQANNEFNKYNWVRIIQPCLIFVSVFIFIFFLNKGVVGAISGYLAGSLGGLVVAVIAVRSSLAHQIDGVSFRYILKSMKYGYKVNLGNIVAFLNEKADLFLINMLINPVSAGIYVIASQMAQKLWILSHAVSIVIFPMLAKIETGEDVKKKLTPLMAKWVAFFTLCGALVMVLFGRTFITLLFGHEYLECVVPLFVLLPGIILGGMSRVFANDIAARGKPEINLFLVLIILGTNIAFNILLIPHYGIIGGALATTIAYVIDLLLRLKIYAHITNIKWFELLIFTSEDFLLLKKSFSMAAAMLKGDNK